MILTKTERKLLEDASLLLSKIGASKASEEIEYVLEEHETKSQIISDEHFKQIQIEENEISKKLERDFSIKHKIINRV